MKRRIEEAIEAQDYEKAEALIEDYKKEVPYDIEIYSYKVAVLLGKEEFESAYCEAKKAVGLNPFLVEANYNLAITAEAVGELVEAWSYYLKTDHLQQNMEDKPIPSDVLNEQMENIYGQIQNHPEMAQQSKREFCLHEYMIYDPFKNFHLEMIGTPIVDNTGQEYYVGRCEGWLEAYVERHSNRDPFRAKCELYPIDYVGTKYEAEKDMLIPIALNWDLNEEEKNHLFDASRPSDKGYFESATCKYSYIPTDKKQKFVTKKNAVWGRPIPLHSADKGKKKLVLSLFLDSFNYYTIEKHGLETLMPYTAKFFEKGAKFTNYYTCSEWTLPTIATYWTGKHPSAHMNLEESYRHNFMGDEVTFSELFKQAGYVTAKIGANCSVTPAQGYIKGFDRFVYQANAAGLTVKETVIDALEHLRTFSDTNQFLWLDVVDLHNVAGGFMRSLEVQANCPLEARYIDNKIQTTVKQSHSENREVIYCNELRKIDFYLSLLYGYIEENYKDEEIIVSFFSDHGTAFIVEDDQPFISDQRMRVPLLIRGSGMKGEIDEIIETTDYAGMIAKLAGVPYSYENKDANLPKCFGGENERQFAISQSIFIGDPYRIAFHAKDTHCYLETKNKIQEQFLVDLSDYDMWMVNGKGEKISDEEKQKQYLDIVKQKIGHLIKYNK